MRVAARLLLALLLALPAAAAAQWWTEPPPLQIRLWTDKPAYRVGDTIRFGLAVNRDAYVALLNVGTSGGTTVIFPNRFHPSPRVEAGREVTIPAPESGFALTLRGPAGVERVRAIASEAPIAIGEAPDLAAAVEAARQRAAPGQWAEAMIAVEVRP